MTCVSIDILYWSSSHGVDKFLHLLEACGPTLQVLCMAHILPQDPGENSTPYSLPQAGWIGTWDVTWHPGATTIVKPYGPVFPVDGYLSWPALIQLKLPRESIYSWQQFIVCV